MDWIAVGVLHVESDISKSRATSPDFCFHQMRCSFTKVNHKYLVMGWVCERVSAKISDFKPLFI
jgi:hypothetical protein